MRAPSNSVTTSINERWYRASGLCSSLKSVTAACSSSTSRIGVTLVRYRSVSRTGVRMNGTVGSRLRSLRTERSVSLSELARRSGIGKGTISELENDRRGARLETLFALATALNAPLGALLADPADVELTRVSGTSVGALLIDRWTIGTSLVEVYRAALAPTRQDSPPHAAGIEETITVVQGRVRVGPVDAARELSEGESLRYPGDAPHRFQAIGHPAEVVLLMHYPAPDREKHGHDH
jgi:transcriptional regulator with XRE-family HTH domain